MAEYTRLPHRLLKWPRIHPPAAT